MTELGRSRDRKKKHNKMIQTMGNGVNNKGVEKRMLRARDRDGDREEWYKGSTRERSSLEKG